MAYPDNVTELTDGVPADGIAAATPLGSGTYPLDDWARSVATTLEAIQTQITGAYTSYTPTLTSSGTALALGTASSATGYYKRLGRRVFGYLNISFGSSGASAGTGLYGLLLPVQPVNRDQPIGIGFVLDASDNYRFSVCTAAVSTGLWAASTSKAALFVNNAAGEGFAAGNNPVQATWPWTWSNGDQVVVNFDYEAAAAS